MQWIESTNPIWLHEIRARAAVSGNSKHSRNTCTLASNPKLCKDIDGTQNLMASCLVSKPGGRQFMHSTAQANARTKNTDQQQSGSERSMAWQTAQGRTCTTPRDTERGSACLDPECESSQSECNMAGRKLTTTALPEQETCMLQARR